MNYDSLKLENQLCHRFYVASNAITRAYRPILNKLDITYPQYVALMALWENDQISPKQLANFTKIDSGSLTSIIKKLQEKKILRIEHSKNDKRAKTLFLTNKGLKLKDKCLIVPKQAFCQVDELRNSEINELVKLLDKVNILLTKDTKEHND